MPVIWHNSETAYSYIIIEVDHYRGGSDIVWTGIMVNGYTELYVEYGFKKLLLGHYSASRVQFL